MSTDNNNLSNVHNWLKEVVPTFLENNQLQTLSLTTDKQSKERPLSISSEDSINLDELINANFTTCMDDETDLTNLASIDLDDSNEDFWKLDNVFHHYVPPPPTKAFSYEQNHLLNTINLSKLSLYDNEYPKRYDRSGSLSSENSSTSSTIHSHHYYQQPKRPQPTSSMSTTTSSRSFNTQRKNPSKSETTTTRSLRASHIPAPKNISSPTPQRTKSTAPILQKKSSTGSLSMTRSASTRSHIPAPPIRSTTSLGLSPVYSSPPARSSTSMSNKSSTSIKSGLRTPSLMRSPTRTKSTSLRMPNSRSFVK